MNTRDNSEMSSAFLPHPAAGFLSDVDAMFNAAAGGLEG